jgi:hypothetical protein
MSGVRTSGVARPHFSWMRGLEGEFIWVDDEGRRVVGKLVTEFATAIGQVDIADMFSQCQDLYFQQGKKILLLYFMRCLICFPQSLGFEWRQSN